mgnify:CR=1 FL=1
MGVKVKTSSRKAKGRNLQNLIAKELLNHTYEGTVFVGNIKIRDHTSFVPEEDDIKPAIMGESGTDIKLSPYAKKFIPFDIECKNQENWSIPSWWKQTVANTEEGRKPLLVIKKNRQGPLVVLRWEDFKELL